MTLAPTDQLRCPPEVLSRVLEGEAVLLHLGTGTYFGMNEVATRAWELIIAGTTVQALRSRLEDEFDVGAEELDRDLTEFIGALDEKKLVDIVHA